MGTAYDVKNKMGSESIFRVVVRSRGRNIDSDPILNILTGGGSRDRTGDLLHAMQALSQLSYTPTRERAL